MACSSVVEPLQAHSSPIRRPLEGVKLPPYALALFEALQFSNPNLRRLKSLNESEWRQLLQFADSSQLTLLVGKLCVSSLPDWIRARIDLNYSNNSKRFSRLNTDLLEIAESFQSHSIEFVVLKGHGHSPYFTPDPLLRAQGDIDFWCLPDSVLRARDVLREMGYRPSSKGNGRHLPAMVRPSNWSWRGDYFAPELPIAVDLHHALWDETEHFIPGPSEDEFWHRREKSFVQGRPVPVLCEADTLAFAALHLLMHLLAGDLRLQRAWEIAHFLHTRRDDDDFWERWRLLYSLTMRQLQTVIFKLTADWFSATLPCLLSEQVQELPADVKLWVNRYAQRPPQARFNPNKDELWLHLALISSAGNRIRAFARRTIPIASASKHLKSEHLDYKPQLPDKRVLEWIFRLSRFSYHARTLLPTLAAGIRWWWIRQGFGRDLLIFQLSSALFDFGEFIFFLLFNLYLLQRGFDERFLGQVASIMTAGTIAGALPAAALTRTIGLGGTLLIALIGAPLTGALRATANHRISILVASFAMGLFMSIWAVSYAPVVSAATNERNRSVAFSLVSAIGIGLGSLAGILGGRLPRILQHASVGLSSLESTRAALLIGCAIAAFGAIPIIRVTFHSAPPQEKKLYPRGRFIWSFCFALFIWSVATGAFNPFFNAYFAHQQQMSLENIGVIFSLSQVATVAAVLFAPLALRRFGQVSGVAAMQAATAIALLCLSLRLPGVVAAFLYISYTSFQYMSEPCLLTMLMSRVSVAERGGASALNFIVISVAGSLAAWISGAAISRLGYSVVIAVAALLATAAAFLFRTLVR